VPVKRSKNQ